MPRPPKLEAAAEPAGAALASDTITAIATAAGAAGVGIVRISGPSAKAVGELITGKALTPRRAHFCKLRDAAGEVIDQGVVLYFKGPGSFTGEDVVELQGHGGPVVMQMLLDRVLQAGPRMARPGEFTERAFLNGKLDLAQAEAVADIINGASEAAVRGAGRSLSGQFSQRVNEIDVAVVELRAFVEAAMDFPDEDLDLLAEGQVAARLAAIVDSLARLRQDCAQGILLRDGIKMALLGVPNVGKSSLLNALSGESRAIVTEVPGTTRDLVRADLVVAGVPVEVVDTAGLRAAADRVEEEGVRRALRAAADADIVLLMTAVDDAPDWSFEPPPIPPEIEPASVVLVVNKLDLASDPERLRARLEDRGAVGIAAETGFGLDRLREVLRERIGFKPSSNLFTARKRHLLAIESAETAAGRALDLAADRLPGELIAEELRAAHEALGEIVGEMSSDELLGEIFSRFCIGK